MSFKLFIISVAKLRNKIENDETKREKFSNRDKNITEIRRISNNQGTHTLNPNHSVLLCHNLNSEASFIEER